MAKGTVTYFNEATKSVGNTLVDWSGVNVKLGLIDNTSAPTADDTDPRWSALGTPDHSANEVTPGGAYPSNGFVLATPASPRTTNSTDYTVDDVSVTKAASSPTNIGWGIIYDLASLRAIAFIEIKDGATLFDLSDVGEDLVITWDAAGVFSITN